MPLIASTQTSLRARRLRGRAVVMFISLTNSIGSLHDRDDRRLPRSVEDGLIGPIRPHIERERSVRSRQPVALLILAGRFSTSLPHARRAASLAGAWIRMTGHCQFDVRYGALCRLKPVIATSPKSANNRHQGIIDDPWRQ